MLEPPRTPQSSGFRRLVVMIAIVAAAGTAAALYRDAARRAARPAPPRVVSGGTESDVDRALRLAAIDSTKKNAWVDELPIVDQAALDPGRAALFLRFANTRRCTCGCGFTLAACQRFDPTCEVSGPLVAALYDSVARGLLADARGLRERPGVGDP